MLKLNPLIIYILFSFLLSLVPVNCIASDHHRLLFHVYRGQSKIGTHEIAIRDTNSFTEVNIEIKLNINFLGFNIYKYAHNNIEKWSGNKLVSLDSKTDQNGAIMTCTLKEKDGKLDISGTNNITLLNNSVLPSSYWNSILVKGNKRLDILNTQDCSFISLNIKFLGNEKIYNSELSADHFKLKGFEAGGSEVDIDLWYDESDNWVKMKFMKDESTIDYVLSKYDNAK